LLSALLLQVFYGIRSERQFDGAIGLQSFVSLVRGTVAGRSGLGPDHLHQNRERLQNGDVFTKFMTRLLNILRSNHYWSDEHFSVDGTLIEAWAFAEEFFVPRTAAATMMMAPELPRPEAQERHPCEYQRPGQQALSQAAGREAKLCYMGHATMENRHGPGGGRQGHACQWHRRTPGFGDRC